MPEYNKIRELFNINSPCGFTAQEMEFISKTYGVIPKALWDYYLSLGSHLELNHAQDFLISPKDLADYDTLDYYVFYAENQGVCAWGIKKEDMIDDDPPVYENYDGDEWFKTCDHLSEFFISMAYLQAIFCFEYTNEACLDIDEMKAKEIAKVFPSKHADSGLYTGVKFYGNHDDAVIAVMKNEDNYLLMFSSQDENHYTEMEKIIMKVCD